MVTTERKDFDPTVVLQFQLDNLSVEIGGLEEQKRMLLFRGKLEFGTSLASGILGILVSADIVPQTDPRWALPLCVGFFALCIKSVFTGAKEQRLTAVLDGKKSLYQHYRRYLPTRSPYSPPNAAFDHFARSGSKN